MIGEGIIVGQNVETNKDITLLNLMEAIHALGNIIYQLEESNTSLVKVLLPYITKGARDLNMETPLQNISKNGSHFIRPDEESSRPYMSNNAPFVENTLSTYEIVAQSQ